MIRHIVLFKLKEGAVSLDNLIIYNDHSEHQKVVEFVKTVVENRSVVDYEA